MKYRRLKCCDLLTKVAFGCCDNCEYCQKAGMTATCDKINKIYKTILPFNCEELEIISEVKLSLIGQHNICPFINKSSIISTQKMRKFCKIMSAF